MKPLTITECLISALTGKVTIYYQHETASNKVATAYDSYPSTGAALRELRKLETTALLICVENWVNHKYHIIKNNPAYNSKMAIVEALRKMDNMLLYCLNKNASLDEVCKHVIRCKPHMQQILPHPHNNTYESSRQRMDEILQFCETVVSNQHQSLPTAAGLAA
ncbi:MAG: hypothetical protein ACXWW0_00250 [Bacteroidia bacterium]